MLLLSCKNLDRFKQNGCFAVDDFYPIKEAYTMEVFETNLTGTDGQIDGLVNTITEADAVEQYLFSSFDDSLTLVISKDNDGNWKRVSSTEPYLSGWADELGAQIDQRNSPTF